jgi:hypothetical protein
MIISVPFITHKKYIQTSGNGIFYLLVIHCCASNTSTIVNTTGCTLEHNIFVGTQNDL